MQRVSRVSEELEFIERCKNWHLEIEAGKDSGDLPVRVAHNDTKLNNVLFDKSSEECVSVIDLDLCMPDSVLYDIGDQIRTTSTRAREDEVDLDRVSVDVSLFEAIISGYVKGSEDLLQPREKELIVRAGMIVSFNLLVRFLGDYLNGDVYFQTSRDGQNLDRARVQRKIIESLLAQEGDLTKLVQAL